MKYECLIVPSSDYDRMVCIAKIFDGNEVVKNFESSIWISEEEFNDNRTNGTLLKLAEDICILYRDVENRDEDILNNEIHSDSEVDIEKDHSFDDTLKIY